MTVALSFPGCHRKGGVERVVFECAAFLAARGHRVTVFADEWEKTAGNGIDYHRVPTRARPDFMRGVSYYMKCSAAVGKAQFDVLNTHGAVCPTGGVHWVQSVHRAWLERSKTFRPALSLARIRQNLNPFHPVMLQLEETHFRMRRYRKIIATTEEVKGDLQRFYDIPAEDVSVVPNGFSATEFNPQRRAERRDAARKRLGLKADHVALLFVANELERKGFRTVLEAIRLLQSPRLRLLVIGRPHARTVREEARRFGVEAQVMSCGVTSDVAEFHAAGDLFVLPTQYEAFSLAILEALGSGVPVITSDVPGARNAICIGVNGFLINDPNDGEQLAEAIAVLLDDDTRSAFSARTPKTVEEFQWSSVLQRYEQILTENCNGH